MAQWNALFPDVLPLIPAGRAEPLVERQILRATQELCRATRVWRMTLEPIKTVAGQAEYEIEFEGAHELVRLESATLDGRPVPLWRHGDGRGLRIHTIDTKTVQLSRAPQGGQELVLMVSVQPSNKATGVDDWLFDQYADTIAKGAAARITGSGELFILFQKELDAINVRTWRGHAAVRPRARENWF